MRRLSIARNDAHRVRREPLIPAGAPLDFVPKAAGK
jgi:hypothetical protein